MAKGRWQEREVLRLPALYVIPEVLDLLWSAIYYEAGIPVDPTNAEARKDDWFTIGTHTYIGNKAFLISTGQTVASLVNAMNCLLGKEDLICRDESEAPAD